MDKAQVLLKLPKRNADKGKLQRCPNSVSNNKVITDQNRNGCHCQKTANHKTLNDVNCVKNMKTIIPIICSMCLFLRGP